MASSSLRMQCHAVGALDGRTICNTQVQQLRSSVAFRGREIGSHGVAKLVSRKVGDAKVRSALMQAAPLPMRSHETRRRYALSISIFLCSKMLLMFLISSTIQEGHQSLKKENRRALFGCVG